MRRPVTLAIATFALWPASAPPGTAAPLDGTITGSDPLHDDRFHHSYMLDGERGQHLLVSMTAPSFAPHIVIQDPEGRVIGGFSGGGPGETVGVDLIVTDSGRWLVMAMGAEPGQTGPYDLDLEMVSREQLAVAATSADASSSLPGKVEAEGAFCDAVGRLVSSAPNGFDAVRGAALDEGRRWESTVSLPDAVSCDIVKFDDYSAVCHLESAPGDEEIVDAFNTASGKLRSCLDWDWSYAPTGGIARYFVGTSGRVTIAVSLTEVGGDIPYMLVMSIDVAS